MTHLQRLIVANATPLAPPPPTAIEEYARWAGLFGIPFRARTPHQLRETLAQVKASIMASRPDLAIDQMQQEEPHV